MAMPTGLAAAKATSREHMGAAFVYFCSCLLVDIALLIFALLISYLIRVLFSSWIIALSPIHIFAWPEPGAFFFLCLAIFLSGFLYEGIYATGLAMLDRTERIARSISWSFFLMILISYTVHQAAAISRFMLFGGYVWALLVMVLVRPILEHRLAKAFRVHPALEILHPTVLSSDSLDTLNSLGFRLKNLSQPDYRARHGATIIIPLDSAACRLQLAELESTYGELGIVPPATHIAPLGAHPVNLRGAQIYVISHPLQRRINRTVKRCIDIIGSLLVLLLTAPFFPLMAFIIKLESSGPVFYGQQRLGKDNHIFKIWKFRTMIPHADQVLAKILQNDPALAEEFRGQFKLKQDPRLTRLGKWLRRTSLDELPQFWNVLRGQMSLVGPRAIVASEQELYGSAHSIVCTVRPGMTGIWQTSGRSNASYSSRRDFDIYYVRNWSLWLDLSLLIKTLQAVILPDAY